MSNLSPFVSGGIGSPLIGAITASITAMSTAYTTQFPTPFAMKEFYIKEYESDGKNREDTLFNEDQVILGFRYNVTVSWNNLTPDLIRSLQGYLNAHVPIRFYPHEEHAAIYHDVYLKGKYSPRWGRNKTGEDNVINDILELSITFQGLELEDDLPYHEIAADGDTPLAFDRPDIIYTADLTAKIFVDAGGAPFTVIITGSKSLLEDFTPQYITTRLLNGRLRVYNKGFRYKANISIPLVNRNMYRDIVSAYNDKDEVGFTPRVRDWASAHYTCRLDKNFKLTYKYLNGTVCGYTGTVGLQGVTLLDDIDFYPATFAVTLPNGGEFYWDSTFAPVTWSPAVSDTFEIRLSYNSGITYPVQLAAAVDGSLQTYDVTFVGNSTQCRIKMLGSTYTDESDADFEIRMSS